MTSWTIAECSEAPLEEDKGHLTANGPGVWKSANRHHRCCSPKVAQELTTWKAEDSSA